MAQLLKEVGIPGWLKDTTVLPVTPRDMHTIKRNVVTEHLQGETGYAYYKYDKERKVTCRMWLCPGA